MKDRSWVNSKSFYNSNYVSAYSFIMNPYVPPICIVSSVIGFIICILIWKIIYEEKYKVPSKVNKEIQGVLIAFTLTNTIGQIMCFISSIVFLIYYHLLIHPSSTYNNYGARFLGMMYIWIRLANSSLIFIMLLYSVRPIVFTLWNFMVIYCVIGPFCLSMYAMFMGVTGFHFSQLPLGSCSIIMSPYMDTFELDALWMYAIEVIDFTLFVFNAILIIQLKLDDRKVQQDTKNMLFYEIAEGTPLIPDVKHLLVLIPCVMMIAKSMEVIRIFFVSVMFASMSSSAALSLGKTNFSLLVIQALLECAQPVLTYMGLQIYLNEEIRFFYFFRTSETSLNPI